MSPEIVDIIVRQTNRKAGQMIKAWNEPSPTCKPKEWKPTDEMEMYAWFGLLLFPGVFHCNNMQAKDLWHSRHFDIYNATITVNNYLVWQAVRTLTSCLSKPFRDAYKGVRKALMGSDGGEEIWRYCVADTNNVIGFAVGAIFVRQAFHGESKPEAEHMINEIREAFKENLNNLTWMDKRTRERAIDKANAITDMIGFPDYILNPRELDKKYADLEIVPNEYFENNIQVAMYNLKTNLEKLDQPVNKTHWGMTPQMVNAYYTPTKNQIVFPAGILQSPFYDTNNPKSLNFGAMGVVMGHELTHAFDDQGREYDKFGNIHRWWDNKSIERFNEKAECIQRQYGSYKMNGRTLNGKQTLGK
ncbi:neprilysin-3 [Anastrepha obliqua]|uniref:neprilysin-3 n=1 Tax=Anastrepha obliqua TaxID=95512 RepID=UPI00240A69CD|nr:neprilysin-3 [Anastrepha obliqua]